jgi:hypothetical protein
MADNPRDDVDEQYLCTPQQKTLSDRNTQKSAMSLWAKQKIIFELL